MSACKRNIKKKLHREKVRLWNLDKTCHWCKKETVLGVLNHKMGASIDHIYSKNHPARKSDEYELNNRIVLACRTCNDKRNAQEMIKIGAEVNYYKDKFYIVFLNKLGLPTENFLKLKRKIIWIVSFGLLTGL